MSKEPVFVTGISIGRGAGFVVAALNAPTGDFIAGSIESAEVIRIAMSLSTLKAVTDLLVSTCHEMELTAKPLERIAVNDADRGMKSLLKEDSLDLTAARVTPQKSKH